MKSELDALKKALEAGLYYGYPIHENGLRQTLSKLGIKSAIPQDSSLTIESLEATLKNVTFNFGQPDELFLDPKSLEKIKGLK